MGGPKEKIVENLSKRNSIFRIVIVTVAFRMGVIIHDVDMVIHVGCQESCLTYW